MILRLEMNFHSKIIAKVFIAEFVPKKDDKVIINLWNNAEGKNEHILFDVKLVVCSFVSEDPKTIIHLLPSDDKIFFGDYSLYKGDLV